jgi:hypothetical protein
LAAHRRQHDSFRGGKQRIYLSTTWLLVFATDEGGHNGVQELIQTLARILRQKSRHEVTVLLQQGVPSPVPPAGFGIPEMLGAIQFDDHASLRAQKIDLHLSSGIKRNRQIHI